MNIRPQIPVVVYSDKLKELFRAKKEAERVYFAHKNRAVDLLGEDAQIRHEVEAHRLNRAWTEAIEAFNRACQDELTASEAAE